MYTGIRLGFKPATFRLVFAMGVFVVVVVVLFFGICVFGGGGVGVGGDWLLTDIQPQEKDSSWFGQVDTDVGMMFPPFGITFTHACFAYRCWSGALDIEVERCRRKASRWWFHLYTLVSTYLGQPQVSENLLPVELWQVDWCVLQGALIDWCVLQGALIVFTLSSHKSVRSFCL